MSLFAAKTFALFLLTALAEIIGCYLPWLWLRQAASAWLLLPAALSLTLFAWLFDAASRGRRPRVCRLWRRLRGGGAGVAVGGRRRAAVAVGCARRRRHAGGDGDHRLRAAPRLIFG
jgi:hypothetical protein